MLTEGYGLNSNNNNSNKNNKYKIKVRIHILYTTFAEHIDSSYALNASLVNWMVRQLS